MTKDEQRAIQKISNMMLDCGIFLEDIVYHKEEESSVAAFTRFKKCLAPNETIKVCKSEVSQEQMETYCAFVDNECRDTPFISIPLSIPISQIECDLTEHLDKRWRDLNFDEKNELLWHYGMNTKSGEEGGCKYYVIRRMYRNKMNKVVHGLVIVGQERTDKEWKQSGKCSMEAYLHTNDKDFHKELVAMGRR